MSIFKKHIGNLYFTNRFYIALLCCIAIFVMAFFIPMLFEIAQMFLALVLVFTIVDYVILFFFIPAPSGERILSERLSNSDQNKVNLVVENNSNFKLKISIIDELPEQLQERDFEIVKIFQPRQQHKFLYTIQPTERGLYQFGNLLVFLRSSLQLVIRKFEIVEPVTVKVFPSFQHLRNYQIISSTHIEGGGSKRVRRVGQSMEFEQIKDYVSGDDIRTINWKATARKGLLMVNNYQDEKSQQVYCIVDKGRLMKMPFEGLTLLDYAINSTLALTNVCLQKQDKVGLISFSNKMGSMVAADRNPVQREQIMQVLYGEKTAFLESDFELLYTQIRHKIRQRSFIILYTNFETLGGLKRQLNYLRYIAKYHLLMVVVFENTELYKLSNAEVSSVKDIYTKTVAEKFVSEKKLIVKELQKHGILSVLTTPKNLTVNTINKYLELKAKQVV